MSGVNRVPSRADLGLAAALGAITTVELHTSWAFDGYPTGSGPNAVHYATVLVMAVALAFRRVAPLVACPVALLVFGAAPHIDVLPNTFGLAVMAMVAAYSAVIYAPSRSTAVAGGILAIALGVLSGSASTTDPWGSSLSNAVFVGLVVLIGGVVRRHRNRTESMRAERDLTSAHAREVASEERARIARELHDVVAHGMSVVVLQARGGRRALARDGDEAREAFDDIERLATECLDEMRRLLHLLRARTEGSAPLAPQPGLTNLHALVAQARAAGAEVELVVDGERRDLAPAIELSAFRIAQEALTNALKHAPGSRTTIRVSYEEGALAIEVDDDGPGGAAGERGHGLIGMRERVELYGGTFDAGSGPLGGFRIFARLPLARTAP